MAEHLDAVRLAQVLPGHLAQGDPGRGLPGAGPLQYGAGIVVAVLLHPGQIGVAGTGPGERGVAGQVVKLLGRNGVG